MAYRHLGKNFRPVTLGKVRGIIRIIELWSIFFFLVHLLFSGR